MANEIFTAAFLWLYIASAVHGANFSVSSVPSNGKIHEGQNLTLSCTVTGKSAFSVNWRGGQTPGPARTQNCRSTDTDKYIISDCNGSSLFSMVVLNVSHSEDRGNWRCVNGGDESTPLNIMVLVPSGKPTITGYNEKEILIPGRNATLTCESSCTYPKTNLTWTLSETEDQQNITQEVTYCRDELYKTTSVLIVPGRATTYDQAYYTCTASNSEPSIPSLNETVLVWFETTKSNPTKPPDSGQPAFPWWAGLLIGISCVAVIGLIIFFVMRFKKRS